MSWNYRVIKHTYKDYPEDTILCIHEVYYDENANITAFSENPVYPRGETTEELSKDLENYKKALNKPVLDLEELKAQFSGDSKNESRK